MQVRRRREAFLGWLLLALGFALIPARGVTGREGPGFQVIVNPSNPVTSVDRAFLREAFFKRSTVWPHGPTIRPVDLSRRFPAREVFSQEILGRRVEEMRRYWQQLIFSGRGLPPPETDSEADEVSYVLRYSGAIGYLPVDANPRGARVVTVK